MPAKSSDRKGVEFPVHCTRFEGKTVYSDVFNSVPLVLFDRPVSNVDFGVLRFSVENAVETQAILDAAVRQKRRIPTAPEDFSSAACFDCGKLGGKCLELSF